MKKFLSNYLFFLSVFIIAFIIIELIFKNITPSKDRYKWQYEELFSPKIKADIVVLGSSRAVRGINPKILEDDENGISVYNFGLNGSNPEFLFNWYNKYFKKHYNKPKLILFEVNWLMFNQDWMWRKIEQDSRYLPLEVFFKEITSNNTNKSTLFFNRFYMFNQSIGKGGMIDSTYNGFTAWPKNNNISKKKPDLTSFDPTIQQSYFEKLLKIFKNDDVEVIFIMLPDTIRPGSPYYSMVEKNLNDVKSKIKSFNYFDYHNLYQNDTLFKDWAHLNIKGANIISEKLKRDLKSIKDINYK